MLGQLCLILLMRNGTSVLLFPLPEVESMKLVKGERIMSGAEGFRSMNQIFVGADTEKE